MVRLFNAKLFTKPPPLTPPTSRVVGTNDVPPVILKSGPRPAIPLYGQLIGLIDWLTKLALTVMGLVAPTVNAELLPSVKFVISRVALPAKVNPALTVMLAPLTVEKLMLFSVL